MKHIQYTSFTLFLSLHHQITDSKRPRGCKDVMMMNNNKIFRPLLKLISFTRQSVNAPRTRPSALSITLWTGPPSMPPLIIAPFLYIISHPDFLLLFHCSNTNHSKSWRSTRPASCLRKCPCPCEDLSDTLLCIR